MSKIADVHFFNTKSLSTIFTIFVSIIHLETVNSNEKTDKKTEIPPKNKVSEPVTVYKAITTKANEIPERYTSSKEFWKRQEKKTEEFCKKNDLFLLQMKI